MSDFLKAAKLLLLDLASTLFSFHLKRFDAEKMVGFDYRDILKFPPKKLGTSAFP